MKIAVFGSTRGTDQQGVIDAINNGTLPDVSIQFVISNKANSGILEKARRNNLRDIFLDPNGLSHIEYDHQLTEWLEEYHVDLVLLIGYMKIMSEQFVKRWKDQVMNIHPSLLPAYTGGMDRNVHAEVLARGCKLTVASLIFIDQGVDTGPIIMQKAVPVLNDDTVDTLKARVQGVEQELLVEAIGLYRDDKICVKDNKVTIN